MITGTTTNYTGRRVDLALFPEIAVSGVPVDLKLSTQPKAIAGLSALAQNFVRILLTRRGTFRGDPTMGSNLFDNIVSRTMQYPTDIEQTFLLETARVIEYMGASANSLPLDEQIQNVRLADQEIQGTSINLTIEIESKAGDKVSFLLPVTWNV